ncbi:MAG TPA: SAM-dependent methyltransferase [Pseudonocardiaceae bacterium]|nr:SAM-dependent methyltransferase [Pseudonocardiaceae bacterium]
MFFRSYGEVVPLFDGFDLVPPGVVNASRWHPDQGTTDDQDGIYAGVGRKP